MKTIYRGYQKNKTWFRYKIKMILWFNRRPIVCKIKHWIFIRHMNNPRYIKKHFYQFALQIKALGKKD